MEPVLPANLPLLEEGLQLLNRADPFVQVSVSDMTGEALLGAAGEIHLETCLKDLRERCAPFATSCNGMHVGDGSVLGKGVLMLHGHACIQVCAHGAEGVAAAGELQGERGACFRGSGRFCRRCDMHACMCALCRI